MVVELQRARRRSFLGLECAPFVGRINELDALDRVMRESRLVTIVGAGGIGKTRLAHRYAAGQASRGTTGSVWFCDLSQAVDDESACRALALALGIADDALLSGRGAVTAVGRALAERGRTLVVLDNVERLAANGARVIVAWLDLAPAARLLATSRTPLDLVGEELFDLAPLGLPREGETESDATRLFVERVRGLRGPTYQPLRDELHAIASLVRLVGGVPLAIELCASRSAPGSMQSLPTHIDEPWSAVAWSFAQLVQWERETLAQCSVFRQSFTESAAQHVVVLPWTPTPMTVSDVLASLRRKSLLQVLYVDGTARLTMCEGVRTHAATILRDGSAAAATELRYVRYFLDLADAPRSALRPLPPNSPEKSLRFERENLRAVLEIAAASRMHDMVLRAAIALDGLPIQRGLTLREVDLLDNSLTVMRTLDPGSAARALAARARALAGVGKLQEADNDARAALVLARQALRHHPEQGPRDVVAMSLLVGSTSFQLGFMSSAFTATTQALELARGASGSAASPPAAPMGAEETLILQQLGAVCQAMGDLEGARSYHEASLEVALELGDEFAEVRARMGLGSLHLESGELEKAKTSYEGALLLAYKLHLQRSLRIVHAYLGVLHLDAGEPQEAERFLHTAAAQSKAVGDLRLEGIFGGIRGAALAMLDRVEESAAAFDLSLRLLEDNPYFRAVVEIHAGHLDLARARSADHEGDEARAAELRSLAAARIEAALAPEGRVSDGGVSALVQRSDDARLAVRILRRALVPTSPPEPREPSSKRA